MYLHEIGEHLDTFNREEVLHNRHIQPKNTIFDDIKLEQTNSIDSILPSVKVMGQESSERLCSRYKFAVEDENENMPETPEHIQYLINNSPQTIRKSTLEIPARLAKSIFSKESPDKWMGDVISVKAKGKATLAQPTQQTYELSPFKKYSA